jgi:alkanesulfonate monooxygenase SsuD/methylene tetrahydromethanopterin reductase-like flavin-dependent oxidoreductase (luciferase family)
MVDSSASTEQLEKERSPRMGTRGFGVAAAVPGELIGPLAAAAEAEGYATFWVNDTPGADGLDALRRAADATDSIRLGVGVIPLDRRGPGEIALQVKALRLPEARLVLGIGSGGARQGCLGLVEAGINALKQHLECCLAVGALGPRMIAMAATRADGVILNWLTPEWAERSASGIRESGERSDFHIVGYVRTALTPPLEALQAEAGRYARVPQYARHFSRMGVSALETCVYGDSMAIAAGLSRFDSALDETVVRAIAPEATLDAYLAVLYAGRPPA